MTRSLAALACFAALFGAPAQSDAGPWLYEDSFYGPSWGGYGYGWGTGYRGYTTGYAPFYTGYVASYAPAYAGYGYGGACCSPCGTSCNPCGTSCCNPCGTGCGSACGTGECGVGLQAEVLEWNGDSVVVRLPSVGLTQPLVSQLYILQADGSMAKNLKFKMLPALQNATVAAN